MKPQGRKRDPLDFLRDIEQLAMQHELQAIRLTNGHDALLGLALLTPDLSTDAAQKALAQAGCLLDHGLDGAQPRRATISPADTSFLELLAGELAKLKESRLPCTLLLMGNTKQPGRAAALQNALSDETFCQMSQRIRPHLNHVDHLVRCDASTLALLLPGTSLGKGRLRAAAILAALENGTRAACCGLCVCHAYDQVSAEEFLRHARQELARAMAQGAGSVCHATFASNVASCQVTVEERAHLFSFLARD